METKDLVIRARDNDEQAIAQLIDLVNQKSMYIALKYTKNDYQKAEDIVQNAIIKAFSSLEQLEDLNRFEYWYYSILNRVAIDSTRTKEIYKNTSQFSELDYDDSNYEDSLKDDKIEFRPKDNFDYSELKKGVEEVMDQLPDAQKQAIYMYYFEDLTTKEIADICEVSESTVKGRLRYGKDKLKETIQSYEKQGKGFYSVSPIPFLLWLLQADVESTIPIRITATSVLQATGVLPPALASSTTKVATTSKATTVKILGTEVSKKVVAGVVAATVGAGAIGGTVVYNSTQQEPAVEQIEEPKEQTAEKRLETKKDEESEKKAQQEKEEAQKKEQEEKETESKITPEEAFAPVILDYQLAQSQKGAGSYSYVTDCLVGGDYIFETTTLSYSFYDLNGDGQDECIIVQESEGSQFCWDIWGYNLNTKQLQRVLPEGVQSWVPMASYSRAGVVLCQNGYIKYVTTGGEVGAIRNYEIYYFGPGQATAGLVASKQLDLRTDENVDPFAEYTQLQVSPTYPVSSF